MKILVTGVAGFIGSAVAQRLLDRGDTVIGIDNFNNYYDVSLKYARIERIKHHNNFELITIDIANREGISQLFSNTKPQRVINLAAQGGVRYSLENPMAYIDSNIVGFANILEGCRQHNVEHLVYASSSSVYGANTKMPYSVHDTTDHPVSLYAATKKSNEVMAHSYSHLYKLPTTGLRFFTVYGPWGRPDMSPILFTTKILSNDEINVFNYGNHRRDFTYIDDIVEGVVRILDHVPTSDPNWSGNSPDTASSCAPYRLYNIGNNNPVKLLDFINALENSLGISAKKKMLPLQAGDVPDTYADIRELITDVGYQPSTPLQIGVDSFIEWYRDYYHI